MPNVSLSERQLRAIAWALAVLKDTNPSAEFPPAEAGCDRSDLILATTCINHALREISEPQPQSAGDFTHAVDAKAYVLGKHAGPYSGRVPF